MAFHFRVMEAWFRMVVYDGVTVADSCPAVKNSLSATHRLGSSTKQYSYVTALIRCIVPTRPSQVRHAALGAVSNTREEIFSITIGSMQQGVDATPQYELPCAILAVARLNYDPTVYGNNRSGASSSCNRDCCYARLIFTLAMNDKWHEYLSSHGHLEWGISLVDAAQGLVHWDLECYLAGIFTYTDTLDRVFPFNSTQERRGTFFWKVIFAYLANR
ncbi:uncharacterized protein BJ212DRAFT_1295831 [Suillus subaureus]|uniref:Uncharacterized protein n=1 Tax=Suillus subaureus TaxID=48587 RepID=A0A9P7ELU7_9AGAM|nr:uncharacterized protein BJ212DRAFT_1295831 [Suillus subaureus]KAG1824731.1 hypothetical protein BJ212DRAFT_1295831 [Suillus subaureus]